MSEPPEPPEEEPAAAADLAELLQQFREPEEPRRKRANPRWLVSAILLSVLGVWLALRASGGGAEEVPKSTAMAGAMLPGKTSERTSGDERPVDVVEDYLARCKKGMTAQEVRWIVEDFQSAGLDEGSGNLADELNAILSPLVDVNDTAKLDELQIHGETAALLKVKGLKLARLQQQWYASAVADGLRLTQLQQEELALNRERFVQERISAFLDLEEAPWLANYGHRTIPYFFRDNLAGRSGIDILFPETGLLEPGYWIRGEECAPWEMVQLTKEQQSLTRYHDVTSERQRRGANDHDEEDRRDWMELLSTRSEDELKLEIPQLIEDVGAVLRFTEEQKFPQDDENLLLTAQAMHPAQLRLFVLLNPDLVIELGDALEKAEK